MLGYKVGEWINASPQRKLYAKIQTELNQRLDQRMKLEQEITKLKEMLEWVKQKENEP